jgi:hypothetical protein
LDEWIRVKQGYEKAGILVFADESVATSEDVPKLAV